MSDVKEVLVSQGTTPLATNPQETGRWLAAEKERWAKVIRLTAGSSSNSAC